MSAGTPSSQPIAHDAISSSWSNQQKRAMEIINSDDWVTATGLLGWKDQIEGKLNEITFFEAIAGYLYDTYVIPAGRKNAGQGYACGTAMNMLSIHYRLTWVRFKTSTVPKTVDFFEYARVPALNGEAKKKIQGLKNKTKKMFFKRAMKNGTIEGAGEEPVYLADVVRVAQAYAGDSSREAAWRIYDLLTAQRAVGRAAEVGFMSWYNMTWNGHVRQAIALLPQLKVAKPKYVALTAGKSRDACWPTAFGTVLALPLDGGLTFDGLGDFVCPHLHQGGAGKLLGKFLKDVVPPPSSASGSSSSSSASSSARRSAFSAIAVPELEGRRMTASGMRPGSIDACAMSMPIEQVAFVSGHAQGSLPGAIWEYLSSDVAKLQPGGIVLAGYPPLPYVSCDKTLLGSIYLTTQCL